MNGSIYPEQPFIRADCNVSGAFDLADAVYMLCYLFPSSCPPITLQCDDACDASDDGLLDIGDPISMLSYLFPPPGPPPVIPQPFRDCGVDPTPDGLRCTSFAPYCP